MHDTRITQQTSSTPLPLAAPLPVAHELPRTAVEHPYNVSRTLQWLLDGPAWSVLRPAVDLVLLCVAVIFALTGLQGGVLHVSALRAPLLLFPPVVMLLLYLRGLYRSRLRALILDGVVPVISAVSVGAMTVAMLGRFANGRAPDEYLVLRAWLFGLVAVGLGRIVLSFAQHWARASRLVGKPVLIMGAGVVGAQVARRLQSHPEYGLVPVGFLDDEPRSVAEVGGRDMPVLGTVEDLDEAVERTDVKHLIVAFSSVADARVSRLIQRCQDLGIEVSVVPRMFDTINNRVGYDTVGGLPLMSFTTVDPRGLQFALKHIFDRLFAAFLMVVLSPVLLITALAVRLSSSGPVLFSQRRVGRDGTMFDLYKFRSMRPEAVGREPHENGAALNGGALNGAANGSALNGSANGAHNSNAHNASANGGAGDGPTAVKYLLGGDTAPGGVEGEDRRTAVGRFLRRSSLDELPQLLNVMRGEMSIIGPRPERPEFVELFRQDIARYGDRHRVKSGITGWAQVHGLRGQTSLAERVEWDNYYIAHWSLGLDLKILVLTLVCLFRNAE